MQRVSIRTLVLMLELLVAVVGFQRVTATRPLKADAVWVAREGIAVAGTANAIDRVGQPAQPPAQQIDEASTL
jgi:hypothetical protein